MKRKRKPRARKSLRHILAYRRGIVSTPLRRAVEALIEPRLMGGRRWGCPTIQETAVRLANGRATQIAFRHWLNGTRRAPAWFIAVLRSELTRQARDRQELVAALAEIEANAGDLRRGALARARARALMMAGKGAIGARKRAHEAANAAEPGKNDPHS